MIIIRSLQTSRRNKSAFTLVEVIVSLAVVTIVSAAMLSTVVFLSKTGYNLTNHITLASEARLALSYISRDLLSAVDIKISDPRHMRISVEQPDESAYDVEYHVNEDDDDFYLRRRTLTMNAQGAQSWTAWETVLTKDQIKDVRFFYYDSEDKLVNKSKIDDIKKVNVSFDMESYTTSGLNTQKQSDTIYSARFVLRNRATLASD